MIFELGLKPDVVLIGLAEEISCPRMRLLYAIFDPDCTDPARRDGVLADRLAVRRFTRGRNVRVAWEGNGMVSEIGGGFRRLIGRPSDATVLDMVSDWWLFLVFREARRSLTVGELMRYQAYLHAIANTYFTPPSPRASKEYPWA